MPIAHSVSQRTQETGVRMAIGAASHDIPRLIFREGMVPVALGLIVGLTVSLAVNRILQSQLVGVSPYDPVTLATAPAVLIVVAPLACHVPSRRALRGRPRGGLAARMTQARLSVANRAGQATGHPPILQVPTPPRIAHHSLSM
ncbi:MAG TPA: FtsX-like permease family protein [Vicinamibacterales bacterium]|nr:FtsX-like permease family protein [Vicinamibacterales bacterium]